LNFDDDERAFSQHRVDDRIRDALTKTVPGQVQPVKNACKMSLAPVFLFDRRDFLTQSHFTWAQIDFRLAPLIVISIDREAA